MNAVSVMVKFLDSQEIVYREGYLGTEFVNITYEDVNSHRIYHIKTNQVEVYFPSTNILHMTVFKQVEK